MTKTQYLNELRKELKANSVGDIEDIIAEYEEHFDFKAEEGVTEEETARKLSSPQEIAAEYGRTAVSVNKFEKSFKVGGLTLLSLPLSLIYVLMWCSVALLGHICPRLYYGRILPDNARKYCGVNPLHALLFVVYHRHCSAWSCNFVGSRRRLHVHVRKTMGKSVYKMVCKHRKQQPLPRAIQTPPNFEKTFFQIKTDRHDRTCLFHFRIRNRLHFNVYRCRQYGAVARLEMVSIIYCRKVIYFFANY